MSKFSLPAEENLNLLALALFRTILLSAVDGIKDRVENTALEVPFELRREVLGQKEGVVDVSTCQNDGLARVSGGGSLSAKCHDRSNASIWLL